MSVISPKKLTNCCIRTSHPSCFNDLLLSQVRYRTKGGTFGATGGGVEFESGFVAGAGGFDGEFAEGAVLGFASAGGWLAGWASAGGCASPCASGTASGGAAGAADLL